jgi:hypothetical protein
LGVAFFAVLHNTALFAIAFVGLRNGAVPQLFASTAGLRAWSEARPSRKAAVHGAILLGTHASFLPGWAQFTAAVVSTENLTGASLGTATTSGTAATELCPFANNTIDRAFLLVANTLLLQQAAFASTEGR